MSVTIDVTDQDVFAAVRAVLLSLVPPNTPIQQGQANRVALPAASMGFIIMTHLEQNRLSTNVHEYPKTENPTTKAVKQSTEYKMQLDFYGAQSQQWALEAMMLFRDEYACALMPPNIQPLHADNAMQMPLINGEEQYEQRWKMTLTLQYNPTVTMPQDYANTLSVGVHEVDTTFRP